MNTARTLVVGCVLAIVSSVPTTGSEITIVPVSASGTHTISGSEIRLQGSGQLVVFEIQVSGWAPSVLRAYQAVLDPASYTSGASGTLTAADLACVNNDNATCLATYGGACSLAGNICTVDADCAFPQFGEVCQGPLCDFPPGVGGSCAPGIILGGRDDYVFFSVANLPAVDLSTPTLRFASAATAEAVPDPGVPQYAGAFAFEVPVGATGTFTIDFSGSPDSVLQDDNGDPILPLTVTPARIIIECSNNADCNDNNACTDDVCTSGTCGSTPNFNDTLFCCDPASGTLAALDDGNECTTGTCNAADGTVTQDPLADGTACGDPSDRECDGADTCDGAGTCQNNALPAGTACGSAVATECDNADTCDSAGTCQANFASAGTTCGDPSNTGCTDPDACDGAGACQANDAADGTACDDAAFCTDGEFCTAGACGSGAPKNCDDSLPCTADSCNEATLQCDNVLNANSCLITGVCLSDGDLNTANDCEECNSALSTSNFSPRPSGALCDDGDACTGTGRVGIGLDTCDGAGVCFGVPDPDCNDNCAFAVEAFDGVNLSNNDNRADDDIEASCQLNSNNDIWFAYTATCDGDVFVSTTGSQFLPSNDPVLSIYSMCPGDVGGSTEIACDDDSGVDLQAALTFAAVAQTTYLIRVAGFENNSGDVVLNILTVNDCLIDGVCYAAGAINPNNDCEACLPDVATAAWSPRIEGSICGDPAESECDSPDACNGAGVCESNPKPDGTACMDDGNECTVDQCAAGACAHPAMPDGTTCGNSAVSECDNADTCGSGDCQPNFVAAETPCGDSGSNQCDAPDSCDGNGACDIRSEPEGTPCDDQEICTGNDVCSAGSCAGTPIATAPIVAGVGPRHISVTPGPSGSPNPIALRLTSPDWPCVTKYIAMSGRLVDNPVFQLADDWGTVIVFGEEITPSAVYDVVAECGMFVSPSGSGETSRSGDVVGPFDGAMWTAPDGSVDIIDVVATIERFENAATAPPLAQVDVWPCVPDGVIDIVDIVQIIDAFSGKPFPCPAPCP